MEGVILYQSKYGAAKKYADWLAEETGFRCMKTKNADIDEVAEYDVIILGGGIYASGIAGLSFLRKHLKRLKGKKIIVFCCGASPYEESAFHKIKERNMTGQLCEIPVFYCRGAWEPGAMSFRDRALCNLLRKAVAKKNPADYEVWEQALMEAGDNNCDWTDKKDIEPILHFINH